MPQSGKALCIGINYAGTDSELRGPVNDALHWLETLTHEFGFQRSRVHVLIDEYPSGEIVSDSDSSDYKRPTKEHILEALAWLVGDAVPGDRLFFLFSGHGVQPRSSVPMRTSVIPGDEALCPVDWEEFEWGIVPQRLVSMDTLQQHFSQLPAGILLTVVLDATLVGYPLQLPFRIDSQCPSREAENDDAARAGLAQRRPDSSVWLRNRHANALPRTLPFELRSPLWSQVADWCLRETVPPLDEGLAIFCFTACHGSQSALDASLDGTPQGCLSYCLLRALELLSFRCSYLELCEAAGGVARRLGAGALARMDQAPQLSYGKNAAPDECAVLDPASASVAGERARRRRGQWQRALRR